MIKARGCFDDGLRTICMSNIKHPKTFSLLQNIVTSHQIRGFDAFLISHSSRIVYLLLSELKKPLQARKMILGSRIMPKIRLAPPEVLAKACGGLVLLPTSVRRRVPIRVKHWVFNCVFG